MEIVITEEAHKRFYYLYHDGRAEYLEEEYETGLGNIYAGKVVRIQKGIDAAFVQIGPEKGDTGFLPLKEIPAAVVLNRDFTVNPQLKAGDVVLVQLSADEAGEKKPKLKCTLTLSGKYVTITLGRQGIGASKQIEKETRAALIKRVKECASGRFDTEVYGLLLRTEASAKRVTSKEILQEANRFTSMLDSYCMYVGPAPSLLYSRPHEENVLEHLLGVLHFSQRLSLMTAAENDKEFSTKKNSIRVIAQNDHLQKLIYDSGFTYMRPETTVCVAGNESDLLARTGKVLADCTSKKLYLNSGGVLYFDKTQALYAIDVNTAHTSLRANPKAKEGKMTLAEKISLEAADVIMRQIRMRNYSGIILIDLPTLTKAAKGRVLQRFRTLAEIDNVQTKVHDITALGIAEITRERIGKPLEGLVSL